MVARLVAEEGDLKGLVLSLDEGESWLIGRDPEACQLVIEDPLASRKHLIARLTPEGISVENLSVTNPAQINDELLKQPRLLQNGDTIKIGKELFRFYYDNSTHIDEINPPLINGNKKPEESLLADEDDESIFAPYRDETNLPEINFAINETGRWLLKVISGPNNGAEFYMQTGHSYIIGTDPHTCDIVFHDTSVSRQHTRISVNEDDTLVIEDLKSRNGVLVNGEKLDGRQPLSPSVIVTMGTTAFVVYDREGEMQTIISPLLPSIVRVLQHDEGEKQAPSEAAVAPVAPTTLPPPQDLSMPPPKKSWAPLFLLMGILGLFAFGSLATYSLFRTDPVVAEPEVNAPEMINQILAPFPSVKYSFNKATGSLLLLGHVASLADKNQLLYSLQNLQFIKSVDDTGLVIDEYVWREINSVLSRNPSWQGISVHSPTAGEFALTGYLQTRKQAEQLSDYMSVNFPYLDLLKNQIVVEEDVMGQINVWLQQSNLSNIQAKIGNGEITLTGAIASEQASDLNTVIQRIREIPGVRLVNNLVRSQQVADMGMVNISNQYVVSGQSKVGDTYTVIINGRIVSKGDIIDGMAINSITPNAIFLEKDGTKYRIDYNK
jgi:type III secretion system YscD/HrpQ family protein